MSLFTRRKELGVQSFMVSLVNNHCEELEARLEGPRVEGRVRLTIVVLVIPVEKNQPVIQRLFAAVTKEFSSTGVALVTNNHALPDEAILGFRWGTGMNFVRAKSKHLNPMGAGFYQLGMRLKEMINVGDYPELASLTF